MLDSALESSYNLLTNLLLLPWILKLIEDMFIDQTPLLYWKGGGVIFVRKKGVLKIFFERVFDLEG